MFKPPEKFHSSFKGDIEKVINVNSKVCLRRDTQLIVDMQSL